MRLPREPGECPKQEPYPQVPRRALQILTALGGGKYHPRRQPAKQAGSYRTARRLWKRGARGACRVSVSPPAPKV